MGRDSNDPHRTPTQYLTTGVIRLAKHDIVVGLDVGTSKICCIIGEVGEDRAVDVVGKGVAPAAGLRKGVVVDIEETVRSITAAVAEAERMAGFNIHSVYTGVGGDHVSSLNSHGVIAVASPTKEIVDTDVKRVVDAAKIVGIPSDRELIHIIPRGFAIDGQNGVRNPVGMAGLRLEVDTHIVTGVVTFLQNLAKCVRKANLELEPSGLVLGVLAASEAVLTSDEKELGAVLVDIGSGTTDLAIFKHGSVYHTASLPIGGANISNDLAVGLRIPLVEAERLKEEYGHARASDVPDDQMVDAFSLSQAATVQVPVRKVAEIVEARLTQILEMVKKHVDQVVAHGVYLAGVTVTGGTAMTAGLPALVESMFNLPARVGMPTGVKGLVDAVRSPIYATAVGLALHGASQLDRRGEKEKPKRAAALLQKVSNWLHEIF